MRKFWSRSGASPRSAAEDARLLVFAPFGVSNQEHLDLLCDAVQVPADSMDIVVRGGRPFLSATKAGARVLEVRLGTRPRDVLMLAAHAFTVMRLARKPRRDLPCLWVDRGWIGPYDLLIRAGLRGLGVRHWRLISPDQTTSPRTAGLSARAVGQVVADNVSAARSAMGAAARITTLKVPARTGRPIRRALYMRLDLPLALSHEPGGSRSHSEGIIGGLQDAGIEVSTVAPLHLVAPARPAPRRVSVDFFAPMNLHPELAEARFNRHIATQLERLPFEDVDFVYERYALFGYAGLELAGRLGVPFVLEANASEVRFRRQYDTIRFGRSATRFEKNLFEAASLVLAVSQRVVDDIREIAPRARVLLVPNGVDPKLFALQDQERTRVRASLSFSDEDVVVGFVGRFYTWHGVETLAAAARKFLAQNHTLRLLLVGDGDLRELLERALVDWPDRVRFTGIVPHTKVPMLMSACDILVSPHAPMDGFIGSPMKVFEYLASGRAVVASRLEQIAEIIEDGTTGLLVKPGDEQELTEAILRLAGSADLRERLGASGRANAYSIHTWPAKVRSILSHITDESVERSVRPICNQPEERKNGPIDRTPSSPR